MNATSNPIIVFRAELHRAAALRIGARRRRRLVLLAALTVAALVTGLSVAATDWLKGQPAPEAVVQDFESYTPQLGFHPEPGKAVLVAREGALKLYATPDREGTYCFTLDSPWKPADLHDGGTCIPPAIPSGAISAGIVGLSRPGDGADTTYVVGGRVEDSAARAIRFTAPDGEQIERSLGPSGFYVAAFTTSSSCPASWSPTFTTLDGGGSRLGEVTITLVRRASPGACLFEGLPVSRSRL